MGGAARTVGNLTPKLIDSVKVTLLYRSHGRHTLDAGRAGRAGGRPAGRRVRGPGERASPRRPGPALDPLLPDHRAGGPAGRRARSQGAVRRPPPPPAPPHQTPPRPRPVPRR